LPPGARKGAPPPKPQGSSAAHAEAQPEPGYIPGTSDVTEIRPPLTLADAADDENEESGEFSVDDEELIDDQQR
jgi:hypothetical protein